MSLLLIPLLVGIGTIAVTWQQTYAQNALSEKQFANAQDIARQARLNDIQIAQQVRFDDIFKAYRDAIGALILDKNLITSLSGSDVRSIAHSQTLDVLRQIDRARKGKAIAYLANLGLIQGGDPGKTPIISLTDADLNGADLNGADLEGADLEGADLEGANLEGAHFYNISAIA